MSSASLARVTLTTQPTWDTFPATALKETMWHGGSRSQDHTDVEDPRRRGANKAGWIRTGETGSIQFSNLAWLHRAHTLHLTRALRTAESASNLQLATSTATFAAAGNTITVGVGEAAVFADYVGFALVIAGAAQAANNTGAANFSRIVDITGDVITLDSDLHQLVDEAAGAAVTLKMGYVYKDGVLKTRQLLAALEEDYEGEDWVIVGPRTDIAADNVANKLTGPAGTFSDLIGLESLGLPVNVTGFSDPANTTPLVSPVVSFTVAGDGSELTFTDTAEIQLAAEAAGPSVTVVLGGSYHAAMNLLASGCSFAWQAGDYPKFQVTYEVGKELTMTTRTRGNGTVLAADGDDDTLFVPTAGDDLEFVSIGSQILTAELSPKRLRNVNIDHQNGLVFNQGGGATDRQDPDYGDHMVTVAFAMVHDSVHVHPLYALQQAKTDVGVFQRFLHPEGSRTLISIPRGTMKGGVTSIGDDRVEFSPSIQAAYDAVLGGVIAIQEIPA